MIGEVYRISWADLDGSRCGHTEWRNADEDEVVRYADAMNEMFPSVSHWVESMDPFKPSLN